MMKKCLLLLLNLCVGMALGQSSPPIKLDLETPNQIVDTTKILEVIMAAIYLQTDQSDLKFNYADFIIENSKRLNYRRGLANGYAILADTRMGQGDYPGAIRDYHAAVEIAQNPKPGFSSRVWHSIGKAHELMGDLEKAKKYYFKSLDINQRYNLTVGLAADYSNLGNLCFYIQKYDSAIYYHNIALDLRTNNGDTVNVMFSYNDLAAIYSATQQHPKAIDSYRKAISIAESIKNLDYLPYFYGNTAQAYLQVNNTDSAAFFAAQASSLSAITRSVSHKQFAAMIHSQVLASQNRFVGAYDSLMVAYILRDTMMNENRTKEIHRLESVLKLKEKEQQNRLLTIENQIQKEKSQRLWLGLGAFGLTSLALGFAIANKQRSNRLLAEKNQSISRKNEEIIAIAENLRTANTSISTQKSQIEKINSDLLASIQYASRIQSAMMPDDSSFGAIFPQSFVFYRPKDIVSGDFYWAAQIGQTRILALADCTGHGVPGALMSMTGINFLGDLILRQGELDPARVLTGLDLAIRTALKQDQGNNRDGMDIGLCMIEGSTLRFAGAMRPAYWVQDGQLTELPYSRQTIGGMLHPVRSHFDVHTLHLTGKGMLFLATDGFQDQFGGKDDKKYGSRRFKELLLSLENLNPAGQKAKLTAELSAWMNLTKQIDDIAVVGVALG